MTIKEVANQIYSLSLGHYVNGVKFTKRELESTLARWMRNAENNKIKNCVVMEICMADGRWLTEVFKYADRPDGYDYDIPDNREQEKRIYEALMR